LVQATWRAGALRPCIELFAPGGGSTRQCTNAFANRIDATLTQTGTYTVLATDWFGTSTGDYTVALERVAPPSGAVPIQYGQTPLGDISLGGDLDLFAFSGTAGDLVSITASWRNGALRPCLELVSPTAGRITTCSNAFTNQIQTRLAQTGTHSVLIRDWFSTSSGGYSVGVQCLSGNCGMSPPPPPPSAPGPPTNLTASVVGSSVQLSWSAPPSGGAAAATSFVVEAGSSPGAANLAAFDTGTPQTSFLAVAVPPGTYFVRVKSRNPAGTSGASNEVIVLAGGSPPCAAPPRAPSGLIQSVSGFNVTLNWNASPDPVTTYVVEAGSSAGAANLANFATGSSATSVGAVAVPGVYFVRLRARNACGTSGASNEAIVTVF
jgi:hypothetical protein